MVRLYSNIDGQLHYWQIWEKDENSSFIHWGPVGETGLAKPIRNEDLKNEIDNRKKQGYVEFNDLETAVLVIEYAINGFGTDEDLDKRHSLENRMDQTLGKTGLGHCDGASTGSGTMEVFCPVVDFSIAKSVIEQDLCDSGFSDYTRIFLQSNVE